MKKFYNYTFQLVCIYIVVLSLFSVFNFDITKTNYSKTIHNVDEEKVLDSTLLVQSLQENEDGEKEESINEEESVEEQVIQTEEPQSVQEEVQVSQPVEIMI